MAWANAHAALQCSLRYDRRGASLPGSLQVVFGAERRTFFVSMPLRRTQRVYCGSVRGTVPMAIRQSLPLGALQRGGEVNVESLANFTATELNPLGDSAVE